jgi:hypothetical protein
MANLPFTSLLPLVTPSVPGAPQPLVLKYIRDAAIRACETSLAWRYTPPPFALQPGTHENFFVKPPETNVHVLFRATCNDRQLTRLMLEDAIDLYPEWADRFNGLSGDEIWALTEPDTLNSDEFNDALYNGSTAITLPTEATEGGGEPRHITQLTPDKYVVLPMPGTDETYTLRMFYALKPTKSAQGMDETVMNELEDIIVHAALQQLLVMPKVVWNDNTLAAYHARQYLYRVNERRARANLGNNRSSLTARGGSFA